jgi:TolB protein
MKIIRILLLAVLFKSLVAQDANYIEATSGGVAIKIGLLPIQSKTPGAKALPIDIVEILKRDLSFGGRFEIVEAEKVDSLSWSQMGVYQFVWGSYTWENDATAIIELRLNDMMTMDLLLGQSYKVTSKNIRKSLHDYTDRVIHQFFGQKGSSSTKISFVTKLGNSKELAIMDYDGANKIKITSHNNIVNLPDWGHDNLDLYYTWFKNGFPEIMVQNLKSGKVEAVLTKPRHAFGAKVSPNGKELVFTMQKGGGSDLYKLNISDKKMTRLSYHWAIETSPNWSPNGYEIVYSSNKSGRPQLYKMDKEGSNVERIIFNGKYVESAAWSPDGNKIAYCIMDDGLLNIYIKDLGTQEVKQMTNQQGNNETPSWSPDGTMLTYSSNRSGSKQIYIMSTDGLRTEQLTFTGRNYSPAWSNYYFKTP